MIPIVVPPLGSTAISGTGMKGAVAGLNHLVHPGCGGDGGASTGGGPTGICAPASPGGASDQHGAASPTSAAAPIHNIFTAIADRAACSVRFRRSLPVAAGSAWLRVQHRAGNRFLSRETPSRRSLL